jgi:hypothetical protein
MIDLYEVFDAENDRLLTELAELRRLLPVVSGPERFKWVNTI